MTSIRLRLLKWLAGPIVAVNLAVAALAWLLAWTPARIAFDQDLAGAAAALAARVHTDGARLWLELPSQAEQMLRADPADTLYFAARTADGRTFAGDRALPPLARPGSVADTVLRGEKLRMLVTSVPVGPYEVRIGVAKTVHKLDAARSAILRALVLIEVLLTLALAALVWFSVTSGLRPLNRMRGALDARAGDELAPVSEQVPFELQALARALNGLLARVRSGARAQHDFLADVAHQLRTPLAGLRTQLEWLRSRHAADADSAHSIGLMLLSTERMIRHTNQLLALARAEPSHFEKARLEPTDLARLIGEAVQSFVEQAAARRIDLGFALEPVLVAGDRFLLRDLIDNLVDNALRYTPEGGTVNVGCRIEGGQGVLQVDDSGPGIPPARREAVFQRFVRLDDKTTGTGLGLAIVRDIARVHGATIALEDHPRGQGAVFTLRFPLARA